MNVSGEQATSMYTQRLLLRLPTEADADALAQLMSPRISARLASWPAFLQAPSAASLITDTLALHAAHRALPFIIERRADGEVLGWISAAISRNDPRRAVLTYWLGERFQGQGIMREAASATLPAVFAWLPVSAVRAAVQPDNLPSRCVLQALGMQPLGRGRIWCASRGQEESCEWWEVPRPILTPRSELVAELVPLAASSPVATAAGQLPATLPN